MGTDNLFWKRKTKTPVRKSKTRGIPPTSFLIVCEGKKTEPNYFKAFKLKSANIKVVGCGDNTLSLMNKTCKIRDKAANDEEIFDQVWCVFDRDSFPLKNFNEAIHLAEREKIKVAYSKNLGDRGRPAGV